jgi:flagellin-specific chaperone FliS
LNYYNYFTEIEETFIRRRGKNLMLSPLDWTLIESWQEREIPLHIVLRGIESVFDVSDKQPQRKRTIKSIAYCKEEIEAQFAEWLETQTGKSSETPTAQTNDLLSNESVSEHLDSVMSALENTKNANLREDFERAITRLTELKTNLNNDFEEVEKNLSDIENFLDRALLTNTDKVHLTRMEAETAKNLSNYKGKMEAEVYQKTYDLMLLKKLRDEAEIPRLSLFYL